MPDVSAFAPSLASFAAWPPAIEETHISVVVLIGDRVVKLRKPIEVPFLDWRAREARLDMCHREVELNRRICPVRGRGLRVLAAADLLPELTETTDWREKLVHTIGFGAGIGVLLFAALVA